MNCRKKFFFKMIGMSIITLIISFITITSFSSYILLPKEINLKKGTVTYLEFNKFFDITVESDVVNVISVSNKPLGDIGISSEEIGKAKMTIKAFGIPLKKVGLDIIPNEEVIPYGKTVGIKIDTDGIMVLGTGEVETVDGKSINPSEGKLKSGDLLLKVNGIKLKNKEDLVKEINKNDMLEIEVNRNQNIIQVSIEPIKDKENNENKIGIWVRDSTQGIGTITYYNPTTKKFAALGHGILDIDTKQLISIRDGEILDAKVLNIIRGEKGNPGELVGNIKKEKILGDVKINTDFGVYGEWDEKGSNLPTDKFEIGLQDSITEGPAIIKSNVEGNDIEEYDVYIESVNRYSNDNSKGMIIRVTDSRLLAKTNGIVQGMSGSPVIQNGKLIGAITHVFVQDPTKGYGVFIENMLKQEKLL